MLLEKINGPKDLKRLSLNDLPILAEEVREAVLNRVSKRGGHVSPNLGVVELTIGLHYVFDSPKDKFVFDVSHQTYPHKILTGRKEAYIDDNHLFDISGYSSPRESEHDQFVVGHTSTSISLSLGLAIARDKKNEKHNVIALIGDGSITGGEALEALNYAGEYKNNLIIILNDNQMSIAENHGGLYRALKALRDSHEKCENNVFKNFNLDYLYVDDGNDINKVIDALKRVKDIDHPIVVHMNTVKGKGFIYAEKDKEGFHGSAPFDLKTGEKLFKTPDDNIGNLTFNYLKDKVNKDNKVVLINAATPAVLNMNKAKRDELGDHFIDVGIAEENATGMISGMAKGGAKPVLLIASSFLQRTYDQISQDVCLNNSPVTILVTAGSIDAIKDETHLGIFDIAMISNIPNLVYLSPSSKEEYFSMLDWSIDQTSFPVAIRMPISAFPCDYEIKNDYSDINKYQVTSKGKDVALIGLGNFYHLAKEVEKELKKADINPTIINPRFITGVDKELLESLKRDHRVVVTLEDGIVSGGFGEKISKLHDTNSKIL